VELLSDCNVNFQPKNSAFSSSITYVKWNASITKKLLKNDKGLVRLSVNDILNNNTGYSRSVSGSNIYESNRLVLKRFWMLTLEWSFNGSFNK
jgi:hypothetical protein